MPRTEQLIQEIGQMMHDQVNDEYSELLFYCIYEEYTLANGLYYKNSNDRKVYFVFPADGLTNLVMNLLEEMSKEKSNWIGMIYTIIGEKFNIDYLYPESYPDGLIEGDLRKKLLQEHFNDCEIVYPKP